jgi:O-antigen/teichoic acid export membrane protein
MASVVTMSMSSIQSVSLPEFSRWQDNPVELRKSVLSCIRLTSAATVPSLVGLAAVSTPLMATIGSKWIPASDALKVLCVLGVIIVFAFFTSPLLQALGKTRQMAALEWARTLSGIAALIAAGFLVRNSSVNLQVLGIAFARFVSGVVLVAPVFMFILMRLSGISLRELAITIAPSAVAAGFIIGSVGLISSFGWISATRPMIRLIIEASVGGMVGLAGLLAFDSSLRILVKGMLAPRSFGHRPVS